MSIVCERGQPVSLYFLFCICIHPVLSLFLCVSDKYTLFFSYLKQANKTKERELCL